MIGKILGERYQIISKIGSGGMSHVYKAKCKLLNRIVAIKVLREEYAADTDFVKKFKREAQAVASLSHPNVVAIYDVGTYEKIPYLVMEYVEGTDLKELIKKKKNFPSREAVKIAVQICRALVHAHANNIVHRDIKPHNVLITGDGVAKVTDFGLARDITATTVTYSGTIVGSVHYFSPEHAKGEPTDSRSDLYSLGVVLYELLTGQVPFQADSAVAVALKHIQEKPTPPSHLVASIPPGLEKLVLKTMAKKPEERFSSASELIKAIEDLDYEFSDDEMTKVLPRLNYEEKPDKSFQKRFSRRPLVVAAVAVLVLIVFVGIVSAARAILVVDEITVPSVENLTSSEAVAKLAEYDLKSDIQKKYSSSVEVDKVISQLPLAGTRVKKGRVIELRVSQGPRLLVLEDMRGKPWREAVIHLNNAGFQVITPLDELYDEKVEKGLILGQEPKPLNSYPENTQVYLTVSKGSEPKSIPMPNLIGMSLEEARNKLSESKLELGEVRPEESFEYSAGVIIKQEIFPQTLVKEGDQINLVQSKGPGPVPSSVNVSWRVPEDGQLKIIVKDTRGTTVVYDKEIESGTKIEEEVNYYGKGVLQVYFQEELIEERQLGN